MHSPPHHRAGIDAASCGRGPGNEFASTPAPAVYWHGRRRGTATGVAQRGDVLGRALPVGLRGVGVGRR